MRWDPTIGIDDLGDNLSGQPVNRAYIEHLRDTLNLILHSESYPTVSVKDAIKQVRDAAGNLADANTRIGKIVDVNGNIIEPATMVTTTKLQQSLGFINLQPNDTFLIWPDGGAAAPAYWGSANAARCGVGEADTTRKVGKYCVSITSAGGIVVAWREAVDSGVFGNYDIFKGQKFGFGCWCKSSIANHARMRFNDGSTTTWTDYHSGGGAWEWLSAVHTMSTASTRIRQQLDVNSTGTAYFDGITWGLSDTAPSRWSPSPKAYRTAIFPYVGQPGAIADGVFNYVFARPALVKEFAGVCKGVPTGSAFTIDVEKHDGTTWQSLFSAPKDLIAVSAYRGTAVPDSATYQNYNFNGVFGTTDENGRLRINFDSIGSGTAIDSPTIMMRYLEYVNFLEEILAYNDL